MVTTPNYSRQCSGQAGDRRHLFAPDWIITRQQCSVSTPVSRGDTSSVFIFKTTMIGPRFSLTLLFSSPPPSLSFIISSPRPSSCLRPRSSVHHSPDHPPNIQCWLRKLAAIAPMPPPVLPESRCVASAPSRCGSFREHGWLFNRCFSTGGRGVKSFW